MTGSATGRTEPSVTSAQLRWYERTVRRYFGDDLDVRVEREEEYEVRLHVGRQSAEDGSPAAVIVRERLEAELANATLCLEVGVNFELGGILNVSSEDAERFVATIGFDYVLGLLRGAVVDSLRSVGLPAALLPVMAYGDVGTNVTFG